MVGEVSGSASHLRVVQKLERRGAQSAAATAHAARTAGGLPTRAAEEESHTRHVFAHTHAGEDGQFLVLLGERVLHRTTGEMARWTVSRSGAEHSTSSRMAETHRTLAGGANLARGGPGGRGPSRRDGNWMGRVWRGWWAGARRGSTWIGLKRDTNLTCHCSARKCASSLDLFSRWCGTSHQNVITKNICFLLSVLFYILLFLLLFLFFTFHHFFNNVLEKNFSSLQLHQPFTFLFLFDFLMIISVFSSNFLNYDLWPFTFGFVLPLDFSTLYFVLLFDFLSHFTFFAFNFFSSNNTTPIPRRKNDIHSDGRDCLVCVSVVCLSFVSVSGSVCVCICGACLCVCLCVLVRSLKFSDFLRANAKKVNAWICGFATARDLESA